MSKQALVEVLRRIMKKAIVENAPVKNPEKPKQEPGTKEKPSTPEKPKGPSRKIGDPHKAPQHVPKKATMNEDEMLNKIVSRFKSKKK